MRPSKYSIFLKILEAGNFSAAAEKLHYTQSAVSQLVQSLEQEMQVPLLHRNKQGLTLTAEGERLLPLFREICTAEMHLQEALFDATNQISGTIRIGAISSISCYMLPRIIRVFQAQYPQVKYQVIHGNYRDTERLLLNGKVELAFVRCPTIYQLELFHFPPEPLYVIMPEDHHLAGQKLISPRELDGEDFVLLDDGYSHDLMAYFKTNGTSPKITQTVKGNLALFGFVFSGLGISLVPKPMTQLLPKGLTWCAIEPAPSRSLAIACKDHTELPLVDKLFLNTIIDSSQAGN